MTAEDRPQGLVPVNPSLPERDDPLGALMQQAERWLTTPHAKTLVYPPKIYGKESAKVITVTGIDTDKYKHVFIQFTSREDALEVGSNSFIQVAWIDTQSNVVGSALLIDNTGMPGPVKVLEHTPQQLITAWLATGGYADMLPPYSREQRPGTQYDLKEVVAMLQRAQYNEELTGNAIRTIQQITNATMPSQNLPPRRWPFLRLFGGRKRS